MSLFQSNLRKRIRKLPKIAEICKNYYYSLLFIRVLTREAAVARGPGDLLGEGLPLPEAGAAAAGRRRRAPGLAHPAAPGGAPRAEVPSDNRALSRLQIFTKSK